MADPRFKVDENLPSEVVGLLRQAGYNALSIHDQQMVGIPDDIIGEVCQREQRAIVTLDTDFANIQNYPPAAFSGIFVLRLQHHDKRHVLNTVTRILPQLKIETLTGRLWIVDELRIRIRE